MDATIENLARWIDELAGEIEILRKKVNNAGGDTVTITPALESGAKIADFTIGENAGVLYAPEVPELVIDTTEHIIGKYGNDDLYCKELPISAFPSTAFTPTNYPHGIMDLKEFVAFFCYINGVAGVSGFVPYMGASAAGADQTSVFTINVDATNVVLLTGRDRSTMSGKIILLYTKTPPVSKTKKKK